MAPNGADYVVLRGPGASTQAALRSLDFSGRRTVEGGPGAVQNWHVSLVGIDRAGHRALIGSMDKAFTVALTNGDLAPFDGYRTVVAVISHDDPSDLNPAGEQYAGYSLTTNGGTAHGAYPVTRQEIPEETGSGVLGDCRCLGRFHRLDRDTKGTRDNNSAIQVVRR